MNISVEDWVCVCVGGYIQYCRKRHTARKGKKGPSLVGKSGFSEGVGAEKR